MEATYILAQIWGGLLKLRPSVEVSPLAEVLAALLKVPVVSIVSQSDGFEPLAMKESDELFSGATLGDVLDEELGVFVEKGTVVLVEPRKFSGAEFVSGPELGRVLGNILVGLAAKEMAALSSVPKEKGSEAHSESELIEDRAEDCPALPYQALHGADSQSYLI